MPNSQQEDVFALGLCLMQMVTGRGMTIAPVITAFRAAWGKKGLEHGSNVCHSAVGFDGLHTNATLRRAISRAIAVVDDTLGTQDGVDPLLRNMVADWLFTALDPDVEGRPTVVTSCTSATGRATLYEVLMPALERLLAQGHADLFGMSCSGRPSQAFQRNRSVLVHRETLAAWVPAQGAGGEGNVFLVEHNLTANRDMPGEFTAVAGDATGFGLHEDKDLPPTTTDGTFSQATAAHDVINVPNIIVNHAGSTLSHEIRIQLVPVHANKNVVLKINGPSAGASDNSSEKSVCVWSGSASL